MACRFSFSEIGAPIDRVSQQIEDSFEYLIQLLVTRKTALLAQLAIYRQELVSLENNRIKTENELKSLQQQIEVVRSNDLKAMQEQFLLEIEKRFDILNETALSYHVVFTIETPNIVEQIDTLGKVVKTLGIPKYSEIDLPLLALGRQGKGKEDFNDPRGVAFEEETQSVFICDMNNSSIKVVSLVGDNEWEMNSFGKNELNKPWGILLAKNYIYVTDWYQSSVNKFQRENFQFVKKIGKKGDKKGEFFFPRQLDKGPNDNLYIAEDHNNRISVLDTELNFLHYIEHKSLKTPMDIKFNRYSMFVLTCNSNELVHMLDHNGTYIKAVVSLDQKIHAWFFCLDMANNILISDWSHHVIRVYDENNAILHSIGKTGHDRGEMHWPYGIATTKGGKLILASGNKNYALQTF